jgi:4-carboxymuconolactone decarboxylase
MPLETMTPEQRAVADAILAGPRGSSTGLQGPFEALLHSPDLAARTQEVGAYVRFSGSIPHALNELAILMVARRWSAQFEWYAHRRMALEAGIEAAVADAVAEGRTPELDPDAAAVHHFVAELLDQAAVSDESWEGVVSRWGKRGAIDLTGTVGYYTLVSMILNVDRYPVPNGTELLPEL